MIENGLYAEYQDKEFRCFEKGAGEYLLISEDPEDEALGFAYVSHSLFLSLVVTEDETGKKYRKRTVCEYQGYIFWIIDETNSTYTLYSPEANGITAQIGFSRHNGFMLVVRKDEVTDVRTTVMQCGLKKADTDDL